MTFSGFCQVPAGFSIPMLLGGKCMKTGFYIIHVI